MSARVEGNKPLEDGDLSLAEAAKHLDISLQTVSRWARSGRLPSAITPEGTWRFRLEEVDPVSVHGIEPGDVTSAE